MTRCPTVPETCPKRRGTYAATAVARVGQQIPLRLSHPVAAYVPQDCPTVPIRERAGGTGLLYLSEPRQVREAIEQEEVT